MANDENSRRSDDLEPTGGGVYPHLADYWQIVSRRLWLVLLIFAVTTAAAIWGVSRQRMQYRSTISLQVNDPLQRTRALNPTARISGMEIFVDPIESEIQVLSSAVIARAVVDTLGLRLVPVSPDLVRSDLVRDAWVGPSVTPQILELEYDESGESVTLRLPSGLELASGAVGLPLTAGFLGFTRLARPLSLERSFVLQVLPTADAVEEVRSGISALHRENTNLIDVTFTTPDPTLAPLILVEVAEALREHGEVRVSTAARNEVTFIEQELARARAQLQGSLEAIQEFKESQEFTSLSAQEQALVNEAQEVAEEERFLTENLAVLSELTERMPGGGTRAMDLVALGAALPDDANPQIPELIGRIQDERTELTALLQEERLTEGHPSAQAARKRIELGERELLEALRINLRIIEGRLRAIQLQQVDLRARQRAFPRLQGQLQTLELNQETDQVTYEYLLSQLYQARIMAAAAEPYVDILDHPAGSAQVPPRGRTTVLLGALLGLIVGLGSAFFLEYLDRTVRTTADVEAFLGIPVLGIVPRLRIIGDQEEAASEHHSKVTKVVALDPSDPGAEAYRNLRMNLTFRGKAGEMVQTVLFTSPGPDEGKSTTALNFSVMLAQQGQRVLLMDADLRRPSLHRALDVLRQPGLTDLILGEVGVREAIRPGVMKNLDFLPSGPIPPNPSELLNSRAMERLLGNLEGRYGCVVLDSPPVLAVTDASVLGAHCDGVVMVLRSGHTEQKAAERAVEQLKRIGVWVFGAVLNEVAASTAEESYYLQYYYSYRSASESPASKVRRTVSKARSWIG